MRHGRAKAARKTLRYFERTVNLKSKPYYSVLLDATFLTAMVRITTNTTTGSSSSSSFSNPSTSHSHSRSQEDDIASRIERVLQVGGPSSSSMSSSDDRTTMDYNHTVKELEMIIQSLTEKSTATKKKKKTEEYLLKASLFKNALHWIQKNTISNKQKRAQQYNNNGNSTTNFNRCEILPKFEDDDDDETQQSKQQQQQQQQRNEEGEEGEKTTITITATDAVRRHIALDDARSSKGKERTYIVASQDDGLLYELRYKGTIPIMRLANKATVLILENPSKSTKRNDIGKEKAKWFGRHILEETEQALVDAAKKSIKKMATPIVTTKKRGGGSGGARGGGGNNDSATAGSTKQQKQQQRKIHGPKEPNPLSCKRKRPSSSDGGNNNGGSSSSSGKISSSKKRRERAKQSNSSSSNNNNIEN
ncbi:hypothetical protein FRACYDRAFT_254386 [Fragilariopsis cylindrus CCMP1102]|uniref:UTP23 sensor motif region domain-containing protein n=1 Tax=Fragilariopsis cylindrus CCMP1102 TaxID=635003 RepID=A0A1E7EKW5_9STRA|nr:hypothetical protein FRACYDRAFT_254386 [Fragilariopsis cylindrus CCMP1102]|eukprot:OEU06552.1 hypothetical protein FRACYDRAFT_254386 [Fragilariopsis cylindrus CCMP1102]